MFASRKSRDANWPTELAITITTKTFVRIALLTIVTLVLLMAVHRASHALLLVFTAFFLSLALNGPVHWLSQHLPGKRRGSRVLATSLSFLVVILLMGGFVASIAPPLFRQTGSFVKVAPNLVKEFRSQDSQTGHFIRDHHLEKLSTCFSK